MPTLLLVLAFLITNFYKVYRGNKYIFDSADQTPSAEVAIILGAKIYGDGTLSDMLKDRALTALELYKKGKVKKILASGDHGRADYDEVNAMRNFLIEKNVKPEDLFMDHAGFDTYDSLYRARDVFGVQSAIIVTQAFHLPRAIYIGRSLGIEVYGLKADLQPYLSIRLAELREKFSSVKAFLNILFHSKPKFLGEPIPISGDGRLSWN